MIPIISSIFIINSLNSLNLCMSYSNRREKTRDVRSGEAPCIVYGRQEKAVPHLGLRNRSKLGFAHACTCLEPLSWAQNPLKNHVGEAHSTSASMKGACESAVMLGNVALLLHFYLTLTAKMEDFIAKLKGPCTLRPIDFRLKWENQNRETSCFPITI